MKNLLFFLIVLAGVGLFFHDKQQTADLAKAQADNAQLAQQLSDAQAALNGARLQLNQAQQRPAYQPSTTLLNQPAHSSGGGPATTDPDSLSRPAYKAY